MRSIRSLLWLWPVVAEPLEQGPAAGNGGAQLRGPKPEAQLRGPAGMGFSVGSALVIELNSTAINSGILILSLTLTPGQNQL